MAAPVVFASAKTEPGGTGSSITVTLPTHTVGDELVIFVGNTGNATYTAPTGWTTRDQGTIGSATTGVVGTLLYHRVVSGDSLPLSSPVVNLGATVTRFAHAITLRGAEIEVHMTGPEWVFGRTTGTANPVRPSSVTTIAPEQEALIFYAQRAATNAPEQSGYTQIQESIASGTLVVNSSNKDVATQGTALTNEDASPTSGARWVAMILCAPSDDYPYYRSGAQATVASGTSVTPALPTGTSSSDINANKDLIVATVQAAGNNISIAPNTAADWTEITGFATNTSGNGTTVRKYWTFYDGTLDRAFTRPTSGELSACLTTYHNTHQSTPIGAVNIRQNASSTTSTWDALSRNNAKSAVQATCVADATPSYTSPSGWIERMDGLGITCADQTYDAVGSAASAAFTLSTASATAVGLVEIRGLFVDSALTLTLSDDASSNLSDTLGKIGGQLKTFSDDVNNLADVLAQIEGQYIAVSDDAGNFADGSVTVIGVVATGNDSLQALTDALIQLLSYELALADSEAANWADSHNLLLAQFLALADDEFNLDDIATLRLEQYEVFTDSFVLSDAESLELGINLTLADNADTLADSTTAELSHLIPATDNLPTYVDYTTACLYLLGIEIECVDSEARIGLEFYDSFNLSDAYSQQLHDVTNAIELNLEDSISLSDLLTLGYGLILTDDVANLSDAVTLHLEYQIVFTDDIAILIDATVLQLPHLISFNDSFILVDSESRVLGYNELFADAILLVDAESIQLDDLLQLTDTINFTDDFSQLLAYLLTTSDVLVISDLAALLMTHLLALTDDVNFIADFIQTDSPQGPDVQLGVTDMLAALSDSVVLHLGHFIGFSDNASLLADSLVKTIGFTVIIIDNGPAFTELISFFSVGNLQLSDALALTDSLVKSGENFLLLEDTLAITDNVAVELRGPDLSEGLVDSLSLIDEVTLALGNELQLQLILIDKVILTDHYFDLRHPYSLGGERYVVVPLRTRETKVTDSGRIVIVPANNRVTKIL